MGVRVALATLAVGVLVQTPRAGAEAASEAQLKAEIIERFVRFVDWDERDLPDTFAVCVVGETPMTVHLERIAKRRKLRNRKATVTSMSETANVANCQLVMIAGNDRKRLRTVISRTDGRPILTVAESPGAADQGAIINLFVEENHIKFEVNARAAKDGGLKIRAKLLRAASHVVGGKD
jgi:hypothetical protein